VIFGLAVLIYARNACSFQAPGLLQSGRSKRDKTPNLLFDLLSHLINCSLHITAKHWYHVEPERKFADVGYNLGLRDLKVGEEVGIEEQ
jgi:hypothetical protein